MEQWATLAEFPYYEISTHGHIYNRRFEQVMRVSETNHGHAKISLVNDHGRFTRSVAMLVAETYIQAPSVLCDHVICLDGNLNNLHVDNLAWRPSWFAWKYTRQLKEIQPNHYNNLRVRNIDTSDEYASIVEAGKAEGLLFADIWRSTYTGDPIYPHSHRFEVTDRV